MAAPTAYPMPPPTTLEPPELGTIRTMLQVVRIIAVIFGILALIGGIALIAVYAAIGVVGGVIGGAVWLVAGGIIAFLVYTQVQSIEEKVNARQYEAAKSQTLIWMVLGFIFGILLGVLLLIAYIKFDPVISWQRGQMAGGLPPPGYAPPYGAPQYASPPYAAPPPGAAPLPATSPGPPAPPAPPAVPFCPRCGKPTTYIAQYGRYYCYTDNVYV